MSQERVMQTFVIRRSSGWRTAEELEVAASRSARVAAEEMPDRVRWVRSYVVQEEDGSLGAICIYQGVDAAAVREHATRAGLSADEVVPVVRTVVVAEDPPETG